MSYAQKLRNAGLWQSLRIVIQAGVQFSYMAMMARLLSKSDFGLMALANSFIGFGSIFSEGGMGVALIQRQNINQKHKNAAFQSALFLGLIIFILFYLSAESISMYFKQPELEMIIKITGISIVLSAISSVSLSLLQKRFHFKWITVTTIGITITGYTVGVILAINNWGVWSLVVATVIQTGLSAILMFYYAPIKLSPQIHLKEWKELFSFGSGAILLGMLNYLSSSGINLVLGKIFTTAKLGIFERANTINALPSSYLGNVIDPVIFPAMSEMQDDNYRVFRTYQYALGLVNSIMMPLALFLIFFTKEIVLILLGDKWLDAVVPLQILFVILPFNVSSRMADSVVRAKGFIHKNVIRKLIYVVILICTVAVGANYYGLIGAAAGVTFSYIFNYILMLILVRNIFNKSILDIFLKPTQTGFNLMLLLFPAIIFSNFITHYIPYHPFLYILLNTIIIVITLGVIVWEKPTLLGDYIQETLNHFKPKK